MRGHALPSWCPRCREPSLPSPDQRLIECRKCGLGYDWLRQTDGPGESTDNRRGALPTVKTPRGLVIRQRGKELELLLPRTRLLGILLLVATVTCAATTLAMYLTENTLGVLLMAAMTLMLGAMGATYTFTRRRITVTRTELRVDRVPFRSVPQVVLLSELQQLAIARTRRGRKQLLYRIELWAQATHEDHCLVSTSTRTSRATSSSASSTTSRSSTTPSRWSSPARSSVAHSSV